VNEIGRRLDFEIKHGVYRGHTNEGFDGLWRTPNGRAILVESKSSTGFSIDLTRIAAYRKQVAPELGIAPDDISVLIVVGEEETGELEAQVRGSRFAWDIRILGANSLFRLLRLKEKLDDPGVSRQIQEILIPQEFTRLDGIIDLVFATAEDAQADAESDAEEEIQDDYAVPAQPRASFHAEILPRLEKKFKTPLVKRSRVIWATPDNGMLVSCQVSKEFQKGPAHYWFGLKRTTMQSLEAHPNSYCAFGLGTAQRVVVLPFSLLAPHLDGCWTSPEPDGQVRHWHLRFEKTNGKISLCTNRDQDRLDLTKYLLRD
jgi:hypothetical protein